MLQSEVRVAKTTRLFTTGLLSSADRLPEMGPPGQRYGFDQNYEYRIEGSFNGRKAYDPNSNQILPEFRATKFTVIDRNPGWLFSPKDHYDPYRFTLLP